MVGKDKLLNKTPQQKLRRNEEVADAGEPPVVIPLVVVAVDVHVALVVPVVERDEMCEKPSIPPLLDKPNGKFRS